MGTPAPALALGRGFDRWRHGGRRSNSKQTGRGHRQGRGARQIKSTGSKQDATIAAAFPTEYDKARTDALKISIGGNQGAHLTLTCTTLGTLARATGLAGALYAADKIKTGRRHVPQLTADSSLNRIKQDYIVPTSLVDYFVPVEACF